MHIVVIKLGALGDVVRTSYLVNALGKTHHSDLRLTWVTDESCTGLLRFNPYIHSIGTVSYLKKKPLGAVDWVLSLDDEAAAAELATSLRADRLTGAYIDGSRIRYTPDSAEWFDMGLISDFGRAEADRLKKANRRSHGEIFARIFGVAEPLPKFFGNPLLEEQWRARRAPVRKVVGFNLFAGARWPSKEMPPQESLELVRKVREQLRSIGNEYRLVFLCDQSNSPKARTFATESDSDVWDCSRSTLDYAAAVRACDYVFTTDSLGMHLAIAQGVPNLSFFAPTSAQEIDTFNIGVKVTTAGPDYASYKPDADNSGLTADRIFSEWLSHLSRLPAWR